jgi:hypothetical protein
MYSLFQNLLKTYLLLLIFKVSESDEPVVGVPVTSRGVRATIVAVEKQWELHNLSVCW